MGHIPASNGNYASVRGTVNGKPRGDLRHVVRARFEEDRYDTSECAGTRTRRVRPNE
jgi:hypothetical protein